MPIWRSMINFACSAPFYVSALLSNKNVKNFERIFSLPSSPQAIAELMQEKEAAGGSLCGPSSPLPAGYSPSMQQQQVGTQQHLVVELADSKAKIRRLRQEL